MVVLDLRYGLKWRLVRGQRICGDIYPTHRIAGSISCLQTTLVALRNLYTNSDCGWDRLYISMDVLGC